MTSAASVHTAALSWLRAVFSAASGSFLAYILVCCLLPGIARGAPPQSLILDSPALRVAAGTLYLDVPLSVDDEDGLRDLLKDGAVLELVMTVDLRRKRSWWGNADVAHRVYTSFLRHEPLTREFRLLMPQGDGGGSFKDRNLTRLLHVTWRTLSVPVIDLQALRAANDGVEADYAVHVLLQLRHTEVPPWLESGTLFWSPGVVPEKEFVLEYHY